ncbi:hypothetical protein OLMES_3738 [Oleiphilus messinensis]|uniref:Uncharacterized protein n=1 Tax=Oleiphilus messinensis TaxID=141451 RepID=A0A1Y0IC82_9GAMM|nr:hypothetical protein OLMES_3738 [Oleiphilus messinensis]
MGLKCALDMTGNGVSLIGESTMSPTHLYFHTLLFAGRIDTIAMDINIFKYYRADHGT